MDRPAKVFAALALTAALAACGGSKSDEAAPNATSAATSETTPAAAVAAPPVAFAQCLSCHSVEAGRNAIGPTLHGIVGSTAGDVPGYAFSTALKQSGIVWNRATLEQWLAGPMTMVPGTRMYVSVPDPARRKEIIDYLETLK